MRLLLVLMLLKLFLLLLLMVWLFWLLKVGWWLVVEVVVLAVNDPRDWYPRVPLLLPPSFRPCIEVLIG